MEAYLGQEADFQQFLPGGRFSTWQNQETFAHSLMLSEGLISTDLLLNLLSSQTQTCSTKDAGTCTTLHVTPIYVIFILNMHVLHTIYLPYYWNGK